MTEYELVHEIKNMCPNNQMRDVFFREVETDDPAAFVRGYLKGTILELTEQKRPDGTVTIHVNCDGLLQKFEFTPV